VSFEFLLVVVDDCLVALQSGMNVYAADFSLFQDDRICSKIETAIIARRSMRTEKLVCESKRTSATFHQIQAHGNNHLVRMDVRTHVSFRKFYPNILAS
jgi:hypothetical protein